MLHYSMAGRNTYLFISSKDMADPAEFSLDIPEDAIRVGTDQFIRLTLSQHSIVNTLYNVRQGNRVNVSGTDYSITPGTYKVRDLASAWNALATPVSITYAPLQNKFIFSSTTVQTVTFHGDLAPLFGALQDQSVQVLSSAMSPRQLQPVSVTDLVLHLTHMQMDPPTNLSNMERPELRGSSIFAVIPVRAQPFALNAFYNWNNAYSVDIFDSDPQRIGFRVTDPSGRLVEDLPHWSAVIKVEYLARPSADPALAQLQQQTDYLRLLFMSQLLLDGGAEDGQDRRDLYGQLM